VNATDRTNYVRFHTSSGEWEMPIDIAQLAADDALLDAIANGGQPAGELERLLIHWRKTIHDEPTPQLVDLDTATRVIATARRHRWESRGALIGTAIAWALFVACAVVLVLIARGVL
jgi:prolyl oligopeptidase PreP (S9A serine peptidase family)